VFNGTRAALLTQHTQRCTTHLRFTSFVAVRRQRRAQCHHTLQALLVEKITPVETPGRSIVQIEVPIGTEVLAWEELAVRLGDEPNQLLIGKLVELLGRDGFTDSGFE
jgi:hypothetical protein